MVGEVRNFESLLNGTTASLATGLEEKSKHMTMQHQFLAHVMEKVAQAIAEHSSKQYFQIVAKISKMESMINDFVGESF